MGEGSDASMANGGGRGANTIEAQTIDYQMSSSGGAAGRPWTPPMWLTGEKTKERPRRWKIPMAAMSGDVLSAVQISIQSTQKPHQKEQHQIHIAAAKLRECQAVCETFAQELETLQETKETGLQDVRVNVTGQQEAAWTVRERKIRAEYQRKTVEREQAWRASIAQECVAKRKRVREDQEQAKKKQKTPPEDEDGQETPPTATEEEERGKEEKEEENLAEILKEESLPLRNALAKTQELEQELKASQGKLDQLIENRSEMVWLLKQAIKAEEKQKIVRDKKPEPKIAASKQA